METKEMIDILKAIENCNPIRWRKKGEKEWHEKETDGTQQPNFKDCEYEVAPSKNNDKYAKKFICVNHYEDGCIYMFVDHINEDSDGEITTFYGNGVRIYTQSGSVKIIEEFEEDTEYMDVTIYENHKDLIKDFANSFIWHINDAFRELTYSSGVDIYLYDLIDYLVESLKKYEHNCEESE